MLLERLAAVEGRVRTVVAARRAVDPNPDDPFRGLYLSDDHVDRLLASSPGLAGGDDERLSRLVAAFDLTPLDVDLLLVALAPDLDPRYERLYGYLNDDVSRRRASVALALELCGESLRTAMSRHRLTPAAPLVAGGLVVVEEPERPFPTRSLRVPDRVAGHLVGDDTPDPLVAELVTAAEPLPVGDTIGMARALAAGARLAYLRERTGGAARSMAVEALAAVDLGAVVVDLTRLSPETDVVATARAAGREARLVGAGLVAGPVDERTAPVFGDVPGVVVLTGHATWDPSWTRRVPLLLEAPVAPVAVEELTQFRLGPEQVSRAMESARLSASVSGSPVGPDELRLGARAQNAAGLERLARRIEPSVGWDDLVLPPNTFTHLQELAARVRRRETVLDEWGMRPGGGRGRGITALFAGDSGTGKTMSAEVIAGTLGLDLYTVNLATVVDKYIGETEKNLERIFSEADGVNGILLFDEADALFGKRSEVSDAHDRYANIEVAYLLQRMETFDGLAVLSTNLRTNVDEAFARRLDSIVDFPMPDAVLRRELWDRCLGPKVPRADDLDLDFCAQAFELSGGNIRSIALTAAYLAADTGRAVTMADLIRATHREYRKLGRLSVPAEFGPYFELISM